jgi:hypothetical protein
MVAIDRMGHHRAAADQGCRHPGLLVWGKIRA